MTVGVGKRLRALRKEAGWSQEEVARLVNAARDWTWHQTTVQKIEADTRPLTREDMEALAEVFGMSVPEMFYDEPSRYRLDIDALDGRARALQFEMQALRLRLREVEDEYGMALAAMQRIGRTARLGAQTASTEDED